MKKTILLLLILNLITNCFSQAVGYFNYNKGGVMSWANHVFLSTNGDLIMAGNFNNKPHTVITNSLGVYSANKSMAGSGEMFSGDMDNKGCVYLGGINGSIGAYHKYIVKYNTVALTGQKFARDYGTGSIRYLINDGANIVAVGFDKKPCILKIDTATGAIVWYKEYTIAGVANADAFMIHQSGSSYYITGSLYEATPARSYLMCVDAATGAVNWCKTYVYASSPHFTGMAISSTGIIMCGATGLGGGGNLCVVKTDMSGTVQWSREITGANSWYQKDQSTYNIWGINCAVDQYGAVVVAFEDNDAPAYGGVWAMLAKLNESTGKVMWTKRYGKNATNGFHGVTISGCTYLATGWLGPTIGSSWDYGLVVCDTSGYAGGGATCGTKVTKTNSAPTITPAAVAVTTANLATNTAFASSNTTEGITRNAICNTTSPTCTIPLPIGLLSFYGVANCKDNINDLYWTTANEINNYYFTIERSTNGTTWEVIAKINGVGNSFVTQSYHYADNYALEQSMYYRLKQTDFSGESKYVGDIIVVTKECSSVFQDFNLFPNPADNTLNIQYYSKKIEVVDIKLHDAVGNVIMETSENVADGINTFSYDISNIAQGVYLLSVETRYNTISKKFIKH